LRGVVLKGAPMGLLGSDRVEIDMGSAILES
jgi:hypothetical protein